MNEQINLQATATESPQLTLTLRPCGPVSGPDTIDVTVTVSCLNVAAGAPAFGIPIRVASVSSCDIPPSSIDACDQLGALKITAMDDAPDPSGFLHSRKYVFDRETTGAVTLRYSAKGHPVTTPRRPGPPFDLAYQDDGISGAGVAFLLLPVEDGKWYTKIQWDLDALPSGATAVSSLGDGDVGYEGNLEKVHFAFYMAGKLNTVTSMRPTADALNAYWLGKPNFDAPAVLEWVAKLYPAMSQMLPSRAETPFRVLGRYSSVASSGGAALGHSFMIGYGTDPETDSRIKFLLAHELAHPLAGNLEKDNVEHSWYAEGLAEFYKLMAPLRAGLVTDEEFLAEFARSTRGYYASRHINLPTAKVRALFWKDSQAQRVPYARGLLYLLSLNWRIREASGGQRSLDDLVNHMQDNARAGKDHTLATWRALVVEELGESEAKTLDDMIAGVTLVPPSDVFGERFTRHEIPVRIIELGFEENSLTAGTIEGLNEGSAAYLAGLRNGDAVLSHNYAFQDIASKNRSVTLRASRAGGEAFDVEFIPRGAATMTGYEWKLVGVSPEAEKA